MTLFPLTLTTTSALTMTQRMLFVLLCIVVFFQLFLPRNTGLTIVRDVKMEPQYTQQDYVLAQGNFVAHSFYPFGNSQFAELGLNGYDPNSYNSPSPSSPGPAYAPKIEEPSVPASLIERY